MELISNFLSENGYQSIENIIYNDYFKKNIIDFTALDDNTKEMFEKIKIFLQKIEKYNNEKNYPLHKKTKNFIRILYYIYKYLKQKNIMLNTVHELKKIILQFSILYKYLKKYEKIYVIKNLIDVNTESENFLKSFILSKNLKDTYNNLFKNNNKNNNFMKNIIPLVEDAIKNPPKKNVDSNIKDYKKELMENPEENNISDIYKINKKKILKKIKKKNK